MLTLNSINLPLALAAFAFQGYDAAEAYPCQAACY